MRIEKHAPRKIVSAAVSLSLGATLALGAVMPAAHAAVDGEYRYTIQYLNFENWDTGGWVGSHEGVSAAREQIPESIGLSHASSLRVTGRSEITHGAAWPAGTNISAGNTYEVSIWSRLHANQDPTDVIVWFEHEGQITEIARKEASADGWVEIIGLLDAADAAEGGRLLVTAADADTTYWLDDFLLTGFSPDAPPVTEVTVALKDTVPFPLGAAGDARIAEGAGEPTLSEHFSSISAENHMKPEAWYNPDGTFVDVNPHADSLVRWANENDGRVFGHVMLWHSQIPAWFFQVQEENEDGDLVTRQLSGANESDKQILRDRIIEHTNNVAAYFHDNYGPYGAENNPIKAYEIVNEVVADNAQNNGMRNSHFYSILGEEFIELAFTAADEAFNDTYAAEDADRPVKLFINEYGTEGGDGPGAKLNRYYALVERLLAKDIPVDGVGHQFHVSLSTNIDNLRIALNKFKDLPVVQAVTEFDVTIGTVNERNLIRQGHYVAEAFDIFRDYHAETEDMYSVTVWGLRDMGSWRYNEGAPLLFDNYFNAKWAYAGAAGLAVPAEPKAKNVFGGSVAVAPGATESKVWNQLPATEIAEGISFAMRWAEDHLTVLVDIADDSNDASDAVEFTYAGNKFKVNRDGSGDLAAEVKETAAGWSLVTQVPAAGLVQGNVVRFDVAVTDGDDVFGWNAPGVTGELTLMEELSATEAVIAEDAPVIDAEIDEIWSEANVIVAGKRVEGNPVATAEFRTLWNEAEGKLYLLAEVTDPVIDISASNAHEQDSVEIFLDLGNQKNGSYTSTDMQLRINVENMVTFGSGPATQGDRVQSATVLTDDGYIVEVAIDLLDAGVVESIHGFDVQVNDGDGGRRIGVHQWADATGQSWQNTSRWGVIHLGAPDSDVVPDPDPVDPDPVDPDPVDPKPGTKFAQVVPTPDVSGDGIADVLAVDHDGVLWLYRGKANGGLSVATKVGAGWGELTISAPGDFNSDGRADILAKAANGDLFFYAGNGKGGFAKAVKAGWAWGPYDIIPAGDVTGDGIPDVLAIDSAGVLYYYAGNGKGGFTGKLTRNGQGWTNVDLYPAGDLNGDGNADILSIRKDGTLHTHLGRGDGGFSKSTQTGQGWAGYELFAGSDGNGDGLADLYSRDSANRLWFYAGKAGGFRTAVQVGSGW